MVLLKSPDHIIVNAPAKLNLHLDVGDKRDDGFHDIHSVFQMVSLSDRLEFKRIESPEIKVLGDFDFSQEQNIIFKAVKLFMDSAGIKSGMEILVNKNIPQGGGMGGGSGNAAAALAVCSSFFPGVMNREELRQAAAILGSDVPFFLGEPAAIVQGRGEILDSLKARSDYFCIIIRPDFSIGTQEAFSLLDEGRMSISEKKQPLTTIQLRDRYENLSPEQWGYSNSFLRFLNKRYPALDLIIKYLYDSGSEFSGLTGSGSCIFGVFRKQKTAEEALEKAKKQFSYAKIVVPLDINPFHILI